MFRSIPAYMQPFHQAVLRFSGALDLTTRTETERKLDQIDADIAILDLSEVQLLDAATLGAFVRLRKRLQRRGRLGIVRIIAPPNLRRIFEITQLVKIFDVVQCLHAGSVAATRL